MKYLKAFLTLSICLSALIGDIIVFKSKFSHSQVFRAFSDSAVHATIGFLSAMLFFCYESNLSNISYSYNIIFCTVMSSLIDIDHIFVARSIYWKDLTNLKTRGIFHCTTFWFLITSALLIYSYVYKKINIYVLTWMTILAYSSHHIRDANRRGLWLFPYGHTPPFPKYLYILLISILPNIYSIVYLNIKPEIYKHTVINYNLLV